MFIYIHMHIHHLSGAQALVGSADDREHLKAHLHHMRIELLKPESYIRIWILGDHIRILGSRKMRGSKECTLAAQRPS